MYIRTKDNIYEITDKQYDVLCGNLTEEEKENYKNITSFGIGSIEEGSYESVLIKDIINQSENLEELCDEFVLFYMETKNLLSIPWATYEQRGVWKKEKEHIINEITNHPPYRKPILYGAIWTDKGLIYVAKMNGKGDLELI